jgi:hypothetical protein
MGNCAGVAAAAYIIEQRSSSSFEGFYIAVAVLVDVMIGWDWLEWAPGEQLRWLVPPFFFFFFFWLLASKSTRKTGDIIIII